MTIRKFKEQFEKARPDLDDVGEVWIQIGNGPMYLAEKVFNDDEGNMCIKVETTPY